MTKMIKLSLVAAVAVAGFTTSAAAADLKDTTFSGKMEVEYDYAKVDSLLGQSVDATANQYDIDLDVTAKTKLSDAWTSIVTVQADTVENINDAETTTNKDSASLNSNVNVAKAYFQYANGSTTAKIGRQGVGTPFFDDERADGGVLLHTVGGVTLAAAHFDNVNSALIGDEAVNAAAIIGSVGPVNASLWYAQVSNLVDAYSLNVNGKFGIVNVDLTHTALDTEKDNFLGLDADIDNSLSKLIVSAPVGPVTLTAGYGTTDKDGGLVVFNQDASANFQINGKAVLDLNMLPDADAFLLSVSGTFGDVTASLSHVNGDTDSVDFDETQVTVAYPLAKALKATASYSDYEVDDVIEGSVASIALEYKF